MPRVFQWEASLNQRQRIQHQAPSTDMSTSEDDAAVVLIGPVVSQPNAPRGTMLGLASPEGDNRPIELLVEVTITSPGQGFEVLQVAHNQSIGGSRPGLSHSA